MRQLLEYLSRTGNMTILPRTYRSAFIIFYKYRGEKYVSINTEWLYNNIESFKQYNYYYTSNQAISMTSNLGNDIVNCIDDNPAADYIVIKVDNKDHGLRIIPLPEGEYPKDVERIPKDAVVILVADSMRGNSKTDPCKNMIDRLEANKICSHI